MPYCTECGQEIGEGDRFCPYCGTKVAMAGGSGSRTEAPPPKVEIEAEPKVPASEARAQPKPAPAAEKARPQARQPEFPQPAAPPPAPSPTRPAGARLSLPGVLIAVFWFLYSSGGLGMLSGTYRFDPAAMIDRADWVSVALILGLPIAISVLRPLLDIVLLPLQAVKSRIPVRLLIGIGLVSPFAVSWMLYDIWGLRNYPFLHYSLLFGTLTSYAILRTPARVTAQ